MPSPSSRPLAPRLRLALATRWYVGTSSGVSMRFLSFLSCFLISVLVLGCASRRGGEPKTPAPQQSETTNLTTQMTSAAQRSETDRGGEPKTEAPQRSEANLTTQIANILAQCRKIGPGITRAMLTNEFGPVYRGGYFAVTNRPGGGYDLLFPPPEFQQHQQFRYRGCRLICIDVEFRPSDSKEEQPTDRIMRVSKPYLEAESNIAD
jgi:hypothetical protein